MNFIKKFSLIAAIVMVFSDAMIAPVIAAPADDALKIAQFVASGLKGLGGMNAKFNALFLRDAIRNQMGELAKLSPLEQVQFISDALDKVAIDLGIPRRTIAVVVSDVFELPPGSTFTIGDTAFNVVEDGVILGGKDEAPVSAG